MFLFKKVLEMGIKGLTDNKSQNAKTLAQRKIGGSPCQRIKHDQSKAENELIFYSESSQWVNNVCTQPAISPFSSASSDSCCAICSCTSDRSERCDGFVGSMTGTSSLEGFGDQNS